MNLGAPLRRGVVHGVAAISSHQLSLPPIQLSQVLRPASRFKPVAQHISNPSIHPSINQPDRLINQSQSINYQHHSLTHSRGYGIAGGKLIFWRFPEKYFQNQLTLYTYKNAFVSLQNSGDFQKSICEISSLCTRSFCRLSQALRPASWLSPRLSISNPSVHSSISPID
eukprot:COSAG06_NODE_13293_length_1272_cov_4.904518_1_plen_169_part_00